jgi:hypothetical protein
MAGVLMPGDISIRRLGASDAALSPELNRMFARAFEDA